METFIGDVEKNIYPLTLILTFTLYTPLFFKKRKLLQSKLFFFGQLSEYQYFSCIEFALMKGKGRGREK